MTPLELWIRRHHRRLAFGLFLQRAGEWLAAWLFLFGAAVLTAKLFLPEFWPEVLWLSLLVIPILIAAAFSASRVPFSRTEAVALLDRQLKVGGLVMTLAESDDAAWHNRLPQTPELWKRKLPKLRPVRFFRLVGWPLAFALGALLIPTRNPHPSSGFSPAVGRKATNQLENMLGLLEKSHVVAPEEAAEMKTVIKQLSKETQNAPLTSEKWETVDTLRNTMGKKLRQDEAQLQEAGKKVTRLLESKRGDPGNLLPENQADLDKIADVLKTMSDRGALPELPKALQPGFEQLLSRGAGKMVNDPKLRDQVLSRVQSLLKNRSRDLQKVRSQFDGAFARMPRLGGEDSADSTDSTEPADKPDTSNLAGEGGKIQWGESSEQRQEKFKQVVLPPGYLDDPENQVAGITPDEKTPRTVRPSENVSPEKPTRFESAGGEVRSRELHPRHREVIKKYFGHGADDNRKGNRTNRE